MKKISEKTIERLSLYYRTLYFLSQQGVFNISSRSFADLVALKPEQVRKDLSYFGRFGKTGTGYNVSELKNALAKILGLAVGRKVAIIGMGNLGLALAGYKGFEVLGLKIVAIFDNSPAKIGKKYRGRICLDVKSLGRAVREQGIEMAVLAVPAEVVQEVTQLAVGAGIKALLNFAPVNLRVPRQVRVSNVDLAAELKSLSFWVDRRGRNGL